MLDNELVNLIRKGYFYIPTTYYNMLRLSKEFLAVDTLAEKGACKRLCRYRIADMQAIESTGCTSGRRLFPDYI